MAAPREPRFPVGVGCTSTTSKIRRHGDTFKQQWDLPQTVFPRSAVDDEGRGQGQSELLEIFAADLVDTHVDLRRLFPQGPQIDVDERLSGFAVPDRVARGRQRLFSRLYILSADVLGVFVNRLHVGRRLNVPRACNTNSRSCGIGGIIKRCCERVRVDRHPARP